MIIVLRPHVTEEELTRVVEQVRALGLTPHVSRGATRTIVGCIGDEDRLREVPLMSFPAVESVLPIEKAYKLAAREFAAGDTLVASGPGRHRRRGGARDRRAVLGRRSRDAAARPPSR